MKLPLSYDYTKLKEKTLYEKMQKSDHPYFTSYFWAEDVKKAIKKAEERLKDTNKLKFPLGCDTNLRDATTTCGDISFGNKIILCDNCIQKLINKFEENEKEFDKIFKEEFGGKLIKNG